MAEARTLLGWTPELEPVALVGGLLLIAAGLVSAYGQRAENCLLSPRSEATMMFEQDAMGHGTSISSWPMGRTCTYSAGGETVTIGPGWLPTIYVGVGLGVSLASCVALSRRMR